MKEVRKYIFQESFNSSGRIRRCGHDAMEEVLVSDELATLLRLYSALRNQQILYF